MTARVGETDTPALTAAHDLNNLLTAIISAAEAALRRPNTDAETAADLTHILEGARRGAALVGYPRGEPPAKGPPIWVNGSIRATSRLLTHMLGPGIVPRFALTDPDCQAGVAPWVLDRMLLNLTANARHAMPDGGTVTIGTARRQVLAPDVRLPDEIPPNDYLVIRVADTGGGIAHELLPRILEPGITTRGDAGGSGLGLASVRALAREAGAYLAIESTVGMGTVVEVYLPVIPGQGTKVEEGRVVLLVDDDPLILRVTERLLRRTGLDVVTAGSAEEALERQERTRCDLILSDVAMPGMDGVALARVVLERWPGLPVILTSGYQRAEDSRDLPADKVAFLIKPYGHDDLLAAVARFIPVAAGAERLG